MRDSKRSATLEKKNLKNLTYILCTCYKHDSITLLNLLLKRNETHTHTKVHKKKKKQTLTLFIRAALFVRAPKWKQPKQAPTDQQTQTPQYSHSIRQ